MCGHQHSSYLPHWCWVDKFKNIFHPMHWGIIRSLNYSWLDPLSFFFFFFANSRVRGEEIWNCFLSTHPPTASARARYWLSFIDLLFHTPNTPVAIHFCGCSHLENISQSSATTGVLLWLRVTTDLFLLTNEKLSKGDWYEKFVRLRRECLVWDNGGICCPRQSLLDAFMREGVTLGSKWPR